MGYILLVSCPTDLMQVAERSLTASGHRVVVVCDGGEAWQHIQRERPAVLFLHEMLPTLDGYELLARLHAAYPAALTRVVLAVVLTADGEPSRDWSYPVDGYVMRPYNPWQVVLSVEQLLHRKVSGRDVR